MKNNFYICSLIQPKINLFSVQSGLSFSYSLDLRFFKIIYEYLFIYLKYECYKKIIVSIMVFQSCMNFPSVHLSKPKHSHVLVKIPYIA